MSVFSQKLKVYVGWFGFCLYSIETLQAGQLVIIVLNVEKGISSTQK